MSNRKPAGTIKRAGQTMSPPALFDISPDSTAWTNTGQDWIMITTAIGMGLSEELGGYVSITVAAIIATGILGNIIGESVCRLVHITDPIARGIALGTAAHAMGTAKAMELGPIEGAMSSLSIVVAGVFTVVFASFFAVLI